MASALPEMNWTPNYDAAVAALRVIRDTARFYAGRLAEALTPTDLFGQLKAIEKLAAQALTEVQADPVDEVARLRAENERLRAQIQAGLTDAYRMGEIGGALWQGEERALAALTRIRNLTHLWRTDPGSASAILDKVERIAEDFVEQSEGKRG